MAYQMMKGKKGNNDGFPSITGMIARYSASGLTNEQMATNPVWVDKTGNGHDLQMKNFAWKGMSGVNGYVQNFNDFRNNATVDKVRIDEQSSNSVKVTILATGINNVIYIPKDVYQFNKSYFIKISSEGYNEGDLFLSFYAPSTSTATTVKVPLNPNGITEIPAIKEDDFLAVYLFNAAGKVGSITIEQLPLYPGALVFDGVDDYGVCDNFPILTKEKGYTVVALRQWIEEKNSITALASNSKNWDQDGAFIFEYNNLENNYPNIELSFGSINIFDRGLSPYSYQTSKSYNGNLIESGSFLGSDKLVVAKANENLSPNSNIAIWELVFLDHDATEEELTKIKDYFVKTYPWLFPDQAWTVVGKTNEDEDRATIANITGNGNDLVLSIFGFTEGSGYNEEGEYAGYLVTDGVDDKIESKQPFQLPIKFSMIGSWVFIKKEDKRAGISKENNLIVYDKITGLTLFLNSVESYEEIDTDSFHAISSDGKLYDENWNMLPITVGSLLSDSSTLKIAYDGNNFVQFAFNCMGFYDKILKKDDLLKGWIYLKGLKAQRIPPSKNYILKEDGGYVLQEDGNKILTEQQ
jgi:hypothetical protein